MVPELNDLVNLPDLKQVFAYFKRGDLSNFQNFFKKALFIPSAPPAERILACSIDESSSLIDSSRSKIADSQAGSFEAITVGLFNMAGPKKFSITSSRGINGSAGLL